MKYFLQKKRALAIRGMNFISFRYFQNKLELPMDNILTFPPAHERSNYKVIKYHNKQKLE